MSKRSFSRCTVVILLPALFVCTTALGWAGNSHARLCQITFDDPAVQPLLSFWGIDQNVIENWTGEPGDWQNGQWANIAARAYIDGGVSPNGLNWQALDETTRLKYMTHNLADVGVPLGHSPANQIFSDTGKEAYLEAQVATWSTYPSVAGTCQYTHSRNGHSYSFTGTYSQVLNTFYNACLDNAQWSKDNLAGFPYFYDYNDYRAAGWNGTTIALMLQRASLVDYLLSKFNPPVYPVEYSYPNVLRLSGEISHDMDNIVWNSDGSYSYTGTGITQYAWDIDQDGTWDYVQTDPNLYLGITDLLSYGWQLGQNNYYTIWVVDDEGKLGSAWGDWFLSGGGLPEPATISLLSIGGLALLRRRKR